MLALLSMFLCFHFLGQVCVKQIMVHEIPITIIPIILCKESSLGQDLYIYSLCIIQVQRDVVVDCALADLNGRISAMERLDAKQQRDNIFTEV